MHLCVFQIHRRFVGEDRKQVRPSQKKVTALFSCLHLLTAQFWGYSNFNISLHAVIAFERTSCQFDLHGGFPGDVVIQFLCRKVSRRILLCGFLFSHLSSGYSKWNPRMSRLQTRFVQCLSVTGARHLHLMDCGIFWKSISEVWKTSLPHFSTHYRQLDSGQGFAIRWVPLEGRLDSDLFVHPLIPNGSEICRNPVVPFSSTMSFQGISCGFGISNDLFSVVCGHPFVAHWFWNGFFERQIVAPVSG